MQIAREVLTRYQFLPIPVPIPSKKLKFTEPGILVTGTSHSGTESLCWSLFTLQFIVDNGKEIVAQPGWREKLKVRRKKYLLMISRFYFKMLSLIMLDMWKIDVAGLSWNHGGHVWGNDPAASQASATQLSLINKQSFGQVTVNSIVWQLILCVLWPGKLPCLRAYHSWLSAKVLFVQLTWGVV